MVYTSSKTTFLFYIVFTDDVIRFFRVLLKFHPAIE